MEWILDGDGEEEQMEMGWIRRPEVHTPEYSVCAPSLRFVARHGTASSSGSG